MVSIVIRSYGWMVLLGRVGTVNTVLQALGLVEKPLPLMYNWFGVVVALTHVLLPFMILTLTSVIEGILESLEDTAAVLGAGWWQRFRHVVFPLSMEGVGAGITLVFMLTIGSFVSVLLLGGSDTLVLPLLIYQQVILLNNNFAAALGMSLLAISVVPVSIFLTTARTTTLPVAIMSYLVNQDFDPIVGAISAVQVALVLVLLLVLDRVYGIAQITSFGGQ